MQKRERGAARMAGRNANVDDMEAWRKARGSRASSPRHPRGDARGMGPAGTPAAWEPAPESDPDNPPFWEQDNPFDRRKKENQPRERPHWDTGRPARAPGPGRMPEETAQFRRVSKQQNRQPEGEDSRREFVQRQDGQWEPAGREVRRMREDDWQPGKQGRQIDLREFRDARSRGSRNENRQDERPRSNADDRAPRENTRRSGRHNVLLLVMALLGLAAIAVIIGLKVFEIRSIDVRGNDSVSAQAIIALSGISRGENILKVDLGQAKRNIESDPLLEVLGISRVYPDRISIEVRQRVPHGAIAYMGAYVVIDEKGFVLDVRDSLPTGQYPLVTGVEIQPSEKGKPLMGVDGEQQKTIYELLTALYDNNAMQFVSEADLGNGGDIRLLTSEGLRICLGKPADLAKKAQWIASTVPELRTHGYTSGTLYITGTGSPVYSETGDSQGGQDASNGNQDGSGDGNADNSSASSGGDGDAA